MGPNKINNEEELEKIMPEVQVFTNAVLGSREIRLNNRQESMYPHLMRFCMDFKFRVLQLLLNESSDQKPGTRPFILVPADYGGDPQTAITPAYTELGQLEDHVRKSQVDILHDYLFGETGSIAG